MWRSLLNVSLGKVIKSGIKLCLKVVSDQTGKQTINRLHHRRKCNYKVNHPYSVQTSSKVTVF